MRTLAASFSIFASLLAGCMAVPEAEELVWQEGEQGDAQELVSIPDGLRPEPEPERKPEPEPEPEAEAETPAVPSGPPRFIPGRGPEDCWNIEAVGFPAISADGQTMVVPSSLHLQLDVTPGQLALQWRDVDTGAVLRTAKIFDDADWPADQDSCKSGRRTMRRRVKALNAELASGSWRTMERLPVEIWEPDTYIIESHRAAVPASDRAVQMLSQHGELIVRIPGVKVLERHPDRFGLLYALYGDRETGAVAVVDLNCTGDSCTCDPGFDAQVLYFSEETFDAIAERPCNGEALVDALGDETYCEGLDLGFNGAPYPWGFPG